MKALVLSGGAGTRLRPLTHTSAKQLVPVANKPVLFYGLESIAAAGITEVGIITGDTDQEVRAAVGDGSAFGITVTYLRQEQPLGLAHAVLTAREWLGEDDFVMFLGDNFLIDGIEPVVAEFTGARPDAQILLTKVTDPSAFGVGEVDGDGKVVRLEEKPRVPRSDLALVGIYLFTPAIHEAVSSITPSRRGELEITDAIQWLIEQGRDVRSTLIDGYWKDTGTVDDLLEVNRIVLERLPARHEGTVDENSEILGRVSVGPNAEIRNSRIIGPVVIGSGARINGSTVGPFTSVAEDCQIIDSEIEYSIVLRDSRIEGVHGVEASLIGRNTQVTSAPWTPRAHRLVLGDHSTARISA
ncbi:glucose-1-phosphate thymidylyltransferase [Streptomyces morookaense]|uniref:Glucose-1-phosphate thymidylyltransferase n=1 Tax=Streptomyces morookaense TaxID=1970 RepID=A0A7Y7E8B7_STRMO|nr:glucose-1-phosphate thymidylyltransferase [Streptomyces morookaense]NVK79127.1 glucose-1-phosphate thymidylyltransferase [Streptomyces morookaense]GHF28345.1 glucose-1-phosphate thymidylyltransferase [Streptomyces morookaense]